MTAAQPTSSAGPGDRSARRTAPPTPPPGTGLKLLCTSALHQKVSGSISPTLCSSLLSSAWLQGIRRRSRAATSTNSSAGSTPPRHLPPSQRRRDPGHPLPLRQGGPDEQLPRLPPRGGRLGGTRSPPQHLILGATAALDWELDCMAGCAPSHEWPPVQDPAATVPSEAANS